MIYDKKVKLILLLWFTYIQIRWNEQKIFAYLYNLRDQILLDVSQDI